MYSRRDFGKIVLASLSVSVALAKINSKINGVRLGIQSYSFRTLSLDDAIKAMVEIGIGECELFGGHVEPRLQSAGSGPGQGGRNPAAREEIRKWRLTVPLDHFKTVRKKFDAAGIRLQAYNYSRPIFFSVVRCGTPVVCWMTVEWRLQPLRC